MKVSLEDQAPLADAVVNDQADAVSPSGVQQPLDICELVHASRFDRAGVALAAMTA
jgi:hypothetical protein